MMGYPVAKMYDDEVNVITDKCMTDVVNSLCTSIKRKKRISNKIKEKLMDDLQKNKYELTINTIEEDRIKINNPLTLQNSITMLMNRNKSIYMNFEIFEENKERFYKYNIRYQS